MGANPDTGVSPADTPDQSLPTVFAALSRPRRQTILEYVLEHGELTVADLADLVAEHENGRPLPEIHEDDVLEIYTRLWHVDIPKLQDAGLIAYDQERDLVSRTETTQPASSLVGRETRKPAEGIEPPT